MATYMTTMHATVLNRECRLWVYKTSTIYMQHLYSRQRKPPSTNAIKLNTVSQLLAVLLCAFLLWYYRYVYIDEKLAGGGCQSGSN